MRVETERMYLYPLSDEEMKFFIENEPDLEMKQAYTEMLEGCRKNPDGTGAQYDKSSGRLKDRLRWELHGNEVKMFFVDEDGESDGEEAMAATVEVANSYTLVFTQVGKREWENISLPFYREDA